MVVLNLKIRSEDMFRAQQEHKSISKCVAV